MTATLMARLSHIGCSTCSQLPALSTQAVPCPQPFTVTPGARWAWRRRPRLTIADYSHYSGVHLMMRSLRCRVSNMLSRASLISALHPGACLALPASISVPLCCPHIACTALLLFCPHPAASMYFPDPSSHAMNSRVFSLACMRPTSGPNADPPVGKNLVQF